MSIWDRMKAQEVLHEKIDRERLRVWTNDMGQVTNMGGAHEAGARYGVLLATQHIERHPEMFSSREIKTKGYPYLQETIDKALPSLSDAGKNEVFFQACFIADKGWEAYCDMMRHSERKRRMEAERIYFEE